MVNSRKGKKFEEKTVIKFNQAKNLLEFNEEKKITDTELLEILLEPFFKKFDEKIITKLKH